MFDSDRLGHLPLHKSGQGPRWYFEIVSSLGRFDEGYMELALAPSSPQEHGGLDLTVEAIGVVYEEHHTSSFVV